MDPNSFITQTLAPAVLISGIGLLLLGMNNRFLVITGRIRELNSELRKFSEHETFNEFNKKRIDTLKNQISAMLYRCNLQKQAIFLLYVSMGLTIFTLLSLASDIADLNILIDQLSIFSFTLALISIFLSVSIEGYEMTLALKTISDDFDASKDFFTSP